MAGLKLVSEVAENNLQVLAHMLLWNEQYGLKLLHITDIFPWQDKYEFTDLPNWANLEKYLKVISKFCIDHFQVNSVY